MAPVIEVADPWRVFSEMDTTPHILARLAKEDVDPATALAKAREFTYHAPIAEWMHAILRPVFANQYLDDDAYDSAFDTAEVFLCVVSQFYVNRAFASNPDRAWLNSQGHWFGRSTYRSEQRKSRALDDLEDEFTAQRGDWGPLKAGLFEGGVEMAEGAITATGKYFSRSHGSSDLEAIEVISGACARDTTSFGTNSNTTSAADQRDTPR
jgi:hypothetical protein